jgi:hypothetical protein
MLAAAQCSISMLAAVHKLSTLVSIAIVVLKHMPQKSRKYPCPWPALSRVQSDGELREMLDPDLFESSAAAGASAGKGGSNSSSSSSSGPSYSSGLVQDSVIMLGMLAGINALIEGGLPLAVQVYACRVSGKLLPLPAKQGAEFREKEVAAALQDWDRVNLLELRAFLLQVRQLSPEIEGSSHSTVLDVKAAVI